MNAKKILKIVSGVVIIIDGIMTLSDYITRRRQLKQVMENETENERLFRIFGELKAECEKSDEAASKAIKMMDELMAQIDEKRGIDPNTIDTEIIEVVTVS